MAQLTINEAALCGFTDIVRLDYLDLIALGTGEKATIATIPAGGAVECAGVYEATAFAGTTTVAIDIGTGSSDPDEFIDALDVDAMTAPVFNTGDAFTANQSQPVGGTNTAAPVYLKLTDSSIASATAGVIVVGLRILKLGSGFETAY